MAVGIGALSLNISANSQRLKGDLDRAKQHVESFAERAEKALHSGADVLVDTKSNFFEFMSRGLVDVIGKIPIAGAAAALMAKSVFDAFEGVLERMHEIHTSMTRLGTDAGTISVLMRAAKAGGIDFDSLSKSVGKFQQKLGDARAGGKESQDTFRQLGLNWKALGEMKLGAQLDEVTKRMAAIANPSDRAYFAFKLMGKGAIEALPALMKLSKGMRANAKDAQRLGQYFSEADVEAAMGARKGLKEWSAQIDGIKTRLLLPMIKDFGKGFELKDEGKLFAGTLQQINAFNPVAWMMRSPSKILNEWLEEMRATNKADAQRRENEAAAEQAKRLELAEKFAKALDEIANRDPFVKLARSSLELRDALRDGVLGTAEGVQAEMDRLKASVVAHGYGPGDLDRMLELRRQLESGNFTSGDAQANFEKLQRSANTEAAKSLGILAESATAVDRYRESIEKLDRANEMFRDMAPALQNADDFLKKFAADLGLADEATPFKKYREALDQIDRVRDMGADRARLADMAAAAERNLVNALNAQAEIDPFKKWLEGWNQLERHITSGGGIVSLSEKASKGLLGDLKKNVLGIVKDENPFEKWEKGLAFINTLLKEGKITAAEFEDLQYGIANELRKQAESMGQMDKRTPPALLLAGSAAEFSARNEMNRSSDDNAVDLKDAMKRAAEAQKKIEKNTKGVLDWLKGNGLVVRKA